MNRRALLVFVGTGAACLLPWTVYLALTLPDRHGSNSWKLAWVGFDTGLLLLFAAATVLGLRRRRAAVPLLVATAALLCADAWFDVVLDWDEPDRWVSVAMALLLELPVAVLLLLHQRIVLAAGKPVRRLTAPDIELREESRLLAWAVAHRDEFGHWVTGERAVAHLTAAELARFEDEYRELVDRYCVLRDDPAAGTREIAVRFYAFPHPGVRQLG
jgi:hypothetical protein